MAKVIGTVLQSRYRIEAELGRGGMGTVYRAHDALLERDVAIKVLSNTGLGTEGRTRLLREAQAVAKLNHPNIVTVYDAGEVGGAPFIVMELVAGEALRRLPTPTLADALTYARQICAALVHAHGHGIIHRDLKPENVIVFPSPSERREGGVEMRVKLMDFGLAWSENAPRLTQDGVLMGTVAYLAPELILGNQASPQSDLYAFGVMLYELLAGRLPFEGSDLALLLGQHLHAPVTPPRTHNPDIPPDLDALVVRLLSKAPEERPASAAEVLTALGAPEPSESVALAWPTPTPAPKHNLPAQLSTFIGREKEIAQVKQLLTGTGGATLPLTPPVRRLVTLTGSGGVGKTRLAIQVGRKVLPFFSHGVWLVELAPLTDPALVLQVVATVFELHEEPSRPWLTVLTDYLREKSLLLILDNCEHLVEACAQLAEALLKACPDLDILATSREALGIAGEFAFRVPSLSTPDPRHWLPLETLAQYEAVKLFVERAATSLPGFAMTNDNASAIVQVCQRLDGIPLAIELAAARVKVLQVEQIATRLDDRFRLLTGGSRTALQRHQTLRSLIDWSHSLLTESEQILLRRLSVFAGGWTLEAAEEVCESGGLESFGVLDLLSHLVDKSLVIVDEGAEKPRYRMLETIRQYAREILFNSGEEEQLRDRHLNSMLKLVEKAEPEIIGHDQLIWLDRLDLEIDNLRAALEWAFSVGDTEASLRLAGSAFWFWTIRGYWHEAQRWLKDALDKSGAEKRTKARAKALNAIGFILWLSGEYAEARAVLDESVSIGRAIEEKLSLAVSLIWLGRVIFSLGDYAASRRVLDEGLALSRELGDKHAIGWSLVGFGEIKSSQGNYKEAQAFFEESMVLLREIGDKNWLAYAARRLAHIALRQTNYRRAFVLCAESLTLNVEMGDKRGVAACLAAMASMSAAQGHATHAARLYGATAALLESFGVQLIPWDQIESEPYMIGTRAEIGEDEYTKAYSEGQAMTLDQAIAYALEEVGP
jgi:non-specific serine/threonine protein kinase